MRRRLRAPAQSCCGPHFQQGCLPIRDRPFPAVDRFEADQAPRRLANNSVTDPLNFSGAREQALR